MSQAPMITIVVDSYVGALLAIGFMIPLGIATLCAGYILGTFCWDRLRKTPLGCFIVHRFTRMAPSKFYPEDASDARFVETTIIAAIKSGRINLKDAS